MDMITRIELEDALKVHTKVMARIKDVAMRVAHLSGEFDYIKGEVDEPKYWTMESFHVRLEEPTGTDAEYRRSIAVNVRISTCSRSEDDDEDRRITRTVHFPVRYLLEEGWDEEVLKQARNRKRWWARIQLEGSEKSIKEREEELAKWKANLEELKKTAAEPDEE